MDQDILAQMIATLQGNQKSFSDKLKERSANFTNNINPAASKVFEDSLSGNRGVRVSSTDLMNNFSGFQNAAGAYVNRESAQLNNTNRDLLSALGLQMDQQNSDRAYELDIMKALGAGGYDSSGNPIPTGQAAVTKVIKDGGGNLLTGGSVTDRVAQAEAILQSGGVQAWRQNQPLDALRNDKQRERSAIQQGLLTDIDIVATSFKPGASADLMPFSEGNLSGPIMSKLGFLRSKGAQEAQAAVGKLESLQIKDLSGAAVSVQEATRLRGFLPSAKDQENEIANKADALRRGILMNQEISEIALREGIGEEEAYKKYKAEIFEKYGFNADGTDPNVSGRTTSGVNASFELDQSDEDLINKYKNYSGN